LRAFIDYLSDLPAFILAYGPGLLNQHAIAGLADVIVIMGLILGGPFDIFIVNGMLNEAINFYHHRLIHLVAYHNPDLGLSVAALTHICLSNPLLSWRMVFTRA